MSISEMLRNEYIASSGPSLIQEQYKDHYHLITTGPGQISKGFMAPNSHIGSHHLGIGKPNCI
jgi:hypothetical protein